ncbi:MAG: hypothetical protein IT355_08315 [Gemmatimonadaceae bacterium]|nr:hypothetical protein [Gemmatimonadaceae bacterium]
MPRPALLPLLVLVLAPAVARAQSLSLTGGMSSGDCSGTSYHQAADASGRYVAAEWAVASQFPVPANRGRVRCVVRFTVTVPAGHRLVLGGGSGLPARLATAQFSALRLNGTSARVLVEAGVAIDAGAASMVSGMISGGPLTFANLALEQPAGAPAPQGVCATAAKGSFQVTAAVDAATASDYVVPWPPEPYAEREVSAMGGLRLFYSVVPCPTTRSVLPARQGVPF